MNESVCYLTIYEDNIHSARQIYAHHRMPIRCETVESDGTAFEKASQLYEEGVRVFIARGGVVSVLRKITNIPVISLAYDFMDFYLAVEKAFSMSEKVALIGWYEHLDWFNDYLKLLPKQIKYYELPNFLDPHYHDLIDAIYQCKKEGIEVIVGGAGIVTEAIKAGLKAVLIHISEYTFISAGKEALREAQIQKEQDLRYNQTTAILQNVNEGVIFLNTQGKILQINAPAQALVSGLKIGSLIQDTMIDKTLIQRILNGEEITNYILQLDSYRLVLNVSRLSDQKEVHGILLTFQEASHIEQTEKSLRQDIINKGLYSRHTFNDIIGNSPIIDRARETARLYAKSSGTVLICGETGTGKELFAQSIHAASSRCKEAFVAINCASLPEGILESELFGYVKGAFTGARNEGKAGIFEIANKGTIFLDEIGEISPKLQARLLRVLQEKEIMRLGDSRVIPVDVRIIVATNKNLLHEVKCKNFREDLYYRLCVLVLELPPLRKRKEDLIPIANHILWKNHHIRYRWNQNDIALISEYDWPGNIRELSNFIERLIALCPNDTSMSLYLQYALYPVSSATPSSDSEENEILRVLAECKGNRKQAAQKLGISRSTLWRKLRELEITDQATS